MTLIWLSPGLPASRSALAAALGPAYEVSDAPGLPPSGTSVAIATVFERPLLERLAALPSAGALLLLKPPGTATPMDLPFTSGPTSVVQASDVPEVTSAIGDMLAGPPALWASTGLAGGGFGWHSDPAPTGELPYGGAAAAGAGAASPRRRRRNWLATGGVIGAAALAAVLVLATQGGASNTAANGFGAGGPGGVTNNSGGGSNGTGGNGSNGFAPGTGEGSMPGGTGPNTADPNAGDPNQSQSRQAQIQAFEACLRENGVDVDALRASGRPRLDLSDPTNAKAFQQCVSQLPRRGDRFGDDDDDHGGLGAGGGTPGGEAPSTSGSGSATTRT